MLASDRERCRACFARHRAKLRFRGKRPSSSKDKTQAVVPIFSAVAIRAHVRIADEQMQPPIFPIIGQRLVARIDDGAIELHPLVNVVDDVIGALAELEIDLALRLRRLEIERQRIRLPDAPRAGENLARREKGQQGSENRRRELRLASHQIILVATERRAGVMVDVVLDERDAVLRAESNRAPIAAGRLPRART